MKLFLGLLIILSLPLHADSSATPKSINKFYSYDYELKIDGEVPTTPVAFELHLSGSLQVGCNVQHLDPAVVQVSDFDKPTVYYIDVKWDEGPPIKGCVLTTMMALDSVGIDVKASSGHVTFVAPENLHIELRRIRKLP